MQTAACTAAAVTSRIKKARIPRSYPPAIDNATRKMPAPSPDAIVVKPPPLNPEARRFPHRIDEFPARQLLILGDPGLPPVVEPAADRNPNRWER